MGDSPAVEKFQKKEKGVVGGRASEGLGGALTISWHAQRPAAPPYGEEA